MIICTQEPFSVQTGIKKLFFSISAMASSAMNFSSPSATADLYIIFTVTDKHGNEKGLGTTSFGWRCSEHDSCNWGEAVLSSGSHSSLHGPSAEDLCLGPDEIDGLVEGNGRHKISGLAKVSLSYGRFFIQDGVIPNFL